MGNKGKKGFCGVCGQGIFYLNIHVPGYGRRGWWHESYLQDTLHKAAPAAAPARVGLVGRLLGKRVVA